MTDEKYVDISLEMLAKGSNLSAEEWAEMLEAHVATTPGTILQTEKGTYDVPFSSGHTLRFRKADAEVKGNSQSPSPTLASLKQISDVAAHDRFLVRFSFEHSRPGDASYLDAEQRGALEMLAYAYSVSSKGVYVSFWETQAFIVHKAFFERPRRRCQLSINLCNNLGEDRLYYDHFVDRPELVAMDGNTEGEAKPVSLKLFFPRVYGI